MTAITMNCGTRIGHDWDYDMHFRFQRILSGANAGKIQLSVKFVHGSICPLLLMYEDENGKHPFPAT